MIVLGELLPRMIVLGEQQPLRHSTYLWANGSHFGQYIQGFNGLQIAKPGYVNENFN